MTELEELQKYAQENGEHYFGIDDLPDDWEEIEQWVWEEIDDGQWVDEWVDEDKYSYSTTIVSKNGKFFAIDQSRSGSYFSDYFYDKAEVYEVERKEKTITVTTWVPKE